jgi:hypothetical protein
MGITKQHNSKFHFDTLKLSRRARRWRNNLRGKHRSKLLFNEVLVMLQLKLKADIKAMFLNSLPEYRRYPNPNFQ